MSTLHLLATRFTFIVERSWKNMYFKSIMAWPPATYDVISRNHRNSSPLNLSHNAPPPPPLYVRGLNSSKVTGPITQPDTICDAIYGIEISYGRHLYLSNYAAFFALAKSKQQVQLGQQIALFLVTLLQWQLWTNLFWQFFAHLNSTFWPKS